MHNAPENTIRILDHMTGWKVICYCAECLEMADERNRRAISARHPDHGRTLVRWGGLGTTTYGRRY